MNNIDGLYCLKKKYETEGEVISTIQYILEENQDVTELRYYYCEKCQAWHITSRID